MNVRIDRVEEMTEAERLIELAELLAAAVLRARSIALPNENSQPTNANRSDGPLTTNAA